MSESNLLKIEGAARRCGVSKRTFWSWVALGRVAVLRLSPRCVRVREEDLEKFLESAKGKREAK